MKVLTPEEEQAHYNAVVKGGSLGAIAGLAIGGAGLALAQRRYAGVRNLTLPLKAFLVTSSATVVTILAADSASQRYQRSTHSEYAMLDAEEEAKRAAMSSADKAKAWAHEHRYALVVSSWAGSISASWWLVNRDRLLTGAQKIVQARMYAQGLTLGVICCMAAFEVAEQRSRAREEAEEERTGKHVKHAHVERYAGEDLWKDMVAEEEKREERMKGKAQAVLGKGKETAQKAKQ